MNKSMGLNMNTEKAERWISLEEAAYFLGVKPSTLREWIRKENGVPARKIGKQWKFKCSELDDWVKSGGSAF
jgi:excisionase family DNA binding protein